MLFAKGPTDLMQRLTAFQRRHTSSCSSAESPNRFPGFINTAFAKRFIPRWCCIDRLNRHDLPGNWNRLPNISLIWGTLNFKCVTRTVLGLRALQNQAFTDLAARCIFLAVDLRRIANAESTVH
jgi:hypothetical protein